jgi:malate dehydrogenase (oxaloacetate-decarboxylating)
MDQYVVDTVLRVRLEHRPGQLARTAAIIGREAALVGEIRTVRVDETSTVRDIVIETIDEEHARRVIDGIRGDGIEILETRDHVFEVHRGGKLHNTSRVRVNDLRDLRTIYTPGVARVSRAIERDRAAAWDLTGLANSVGIFTNGTRVLGMGDIGPLASLPVMEGKAVLYDTFVGISATPILIDTKDPDEFIETVVRISPTFGGIHLEDIRIPDCFKIEDELRRRLHKPVMHDDQHGTAVVTLAAILNACRMIGRDFKRSRLGQVGLGAAGSAIAALAMAYGAGEVMVTDLSEDAKRRMTALGARATDFATIMAEADIVVATTGKPGLIRPDMVRKGQVIFAISNPQPEISPSEAREAGAAFAGDGRSINNALSFPGIFRGVLQARSRSITPAMLTAAAEAIAAAAEPGEVVPSPLNRAVHDEVSRVVAAEAVRAGLAGTAKP